VSNCTDTGKPVFLPWRMSSFVLVQQTQFSLLMKTNLVVTAGMLNPANGSVMTVLWQFINQSVNVLLQRIPFADDRSPSMRPTPTSPPPWPTKSSKLPTQWQQRSLALSHSASTPSFPAFEVFNLQLVQS